MKICCRTLVQRAVLGFSLIVSDTACAGAPTLVKFESWFYFWCKFCEFSIDCDVFAAIFMKIWWTAAALAELFLDVRLATQNLERKIDIFCLFAVQKMSFKVQTWFSMVIDNGWLSWSFSIFNLVLVVPLVAGFPRVKNMAEKHSIKWYILKLENQFENESSLRLASR